MSNPNSIIIYNNNLCPEIWDEYFQLRPDIRLNLLNIAKEFYKKTTFEAPIIDILFMGSLASFNWNKQSDIDVHILINLAKLNMPEETADKMYKVVGSQWNSEHDIQIKNHKVEMNIQPTKVEKPYVNGIYSLIKNQWVKKPTRQDPKAIDKSIIQVKYNGLKKYIIDTIATNNIDKMKGAKDYLDSFRQYGLDTDGELSVENIVYKLLRTKGITKILKDAILKTYDQALSINENATPNADVKTQNFELKFGDPRVNKTAGLITLNGNIWFANCFMMHGMNDEPLGWVINTHQGAWDLKFPKENIKFKTPLDLLEYIQKWYDTTQIKEVNQSDINQTHPQFVVQDKNGIPNLKLLTLDNLKALRNKCVRMAKNIKPDADKHGIRKRATQDFIVYQNEIKRRLEMINRPLMESEDKNYDAAVDFYERKDIQLYEILSFVKETTAKKKIHWKTISSSLLKKTWLLFGKYNKINENAIDKIADQILTNIARLDACNELTGHGSMGRGQIQDETGIVLDDIQWDDMIWKCLNDKHGNDLISDYGIGPLKNLYVVIFNAATPEEKLYACDKALNVVHQRNDLAAMFVEGGKSTLTQIALQGGYDAGYEHAQMNREFREDIVTEFSKYKVSHKDAGRDTWKGPHVGVELELLLQGKKPAALMNNNVAALPYIKNGTLISMPYGFKHHVGYVIGLPSEKWRVEKLVSLINKMQENIIKHNKQPDDRYHAKLGILLGYSNDDIRKFIDPNRTSNITNESIGTDPLQSNEFKKWFGNSKIADKHGNPLRVYHGTSKDFTDFKGDRGNNGNSRFSDGFYFSELPDVASHYAREKEGANVIPVYLNIQSPFEIHDFEKKYNETIFNFRSSGTSYEQDQKARLKDSEILEKLGYDGIIYYFKGKMSEIVAFRPTQIKSAIGNNGQFKSTNSDITNESISSWKNTQAILTSNPPELLFTQGMENTHVEIMFRVFSDEMETLMKEFQKAGYADDDDPDCQYPAANKISEKYKLSRIVIEGDKLYFNTYRDTDLTNGQLKLLRDYCIEHKLRLFKDYSMSNKHQEFSLDEGVGAGIPETDPLHINGERWRIDWGKRKTPLMK